MLNDVWLDVRTRVHEQSIHQSANEIQREMQRVGQDSAESYSKGWARGIERETTNIVNAQKKAADSAGAVLVADRKVTEIRERGERQAQALERAEQKLTDMRDSGTASARDLERAERDVERIRSQHERTVTQLVSQSESLSRARRSEQRDLDALTAAHRSYADAVSVVSGDASRSLTSLGANLGALTRVGGPLVMAGAASGIGQLASVASAAAGSIGVLPGVLGGAATAFGTLKLATLGFGDALDSIDDPEKLGEALKGLAPQAQQAVLAIQASLPVLKQFQMATADAFFANVGPQLTAFLDQILPTVQRTTTGVAGAFNQMFMGLTNELTTPRSMATLQ